MLRSTGVTILLVQLFFTCVLPGHSDTVLAALSTSPYLPH